MSLFSAKDFWYAPLRQHEQGPYDSLIDGDPNAGHGNDIDDIEEQNPGDSADNRTKNVIKSVVVCQHNHKWSADYVCGEDQDPPQIALGG